MTEHHNKVAYYCDTFKKCWYVGQVKGNGGADWGYVCTYRQALPLSPYWQARFRADCRAMNRIAHFENVYP